MSDVLVLALVLLLVVSGYTAGRVHGQIGFREGYRSGYRQGYADGTRNRPARLDGAAPPEGLAITVTPAAADHEPSESRHSRPGERVPARAVRHARG